jgi:hypothetical protein
MADPKDNDDRDRRVASGFPDPADVPGPTERLREIHGVTSTQPQPPKYGRASASTAGSDDYVPIDEMLQGSGGLAAGAADRLTAFARRVGDEAADRLRTELDRRGVAEHAKVAGIGAGQIGVAGALGLVALGAASTAMIAGLSRAMPVWASALVTAGVFGIPAGVLAAQGAQRVNSGLSAIGSPAGS